jgi:HlyD family secretion protein
LKPDLNVKDNKSISSKLVKIIGLIVIVAIAAVIVLNSKTVSAKLFGTKTNIPQKIATVKRGDIQVAIKGSGPIYFTKSNKIYSKIGGTVTAVNFKAGDKVKAGDVIYQLDDKDAQNTMDASQKGLEQSQVAADASDESVSNLTISAPFAGQVSSLTVNKGDNVLPGGNLLTITDTSKLKILLPFNAGDIRQIAVGQAATISITSLMNSVQGRVTYISNQPTATTSGGQLYTVEVQLTNPGAILGGMTASGDIETPKGTVSSTSNAVLNYVNKQTVISKTGGTVQRIAIKESQRVNSGDLLIQMQNNDITRAQQNANLKIGTSQDQIDSITTQLGYYKITAPIDGVLSSVNFQVGDNINAGAQVSEVSNSGQMKFDIPVDEIDVAKLAANQKVNISVDSVPSTLTTPVQGEVESIAVKGTTVSGVTTYPVTIKVDGGFDLLRGGMTANAEVQVDSKQDILYVPIEAIMKEDGKNYVMVKNGTSSGDSQIADISTQANSYYAGAVRKEVEVGVSDAASIEIKSGLNEGDQVILPLS